MDSVVSYWCVLSIPSSLGYPPPPVFIKTNKYAAFLCICQCEDSCLNRSVSWYRQSIKYEQILQLWASSLLIRCQVNIDDMMLLQTASIWSVIASLFLLISCQKGKYHRRGTEFFLPSRKQSSDAWWEARPLPGWASLICERCTRQRVLKWN